MAKSFLPASLPFPPKHLGDFAAGQTSRPLPTQKLSSQVEHPLLSGAPSVFPASVLGARVGTGLLTDGWTGAILV